MNPAISLQGEHVIYFSKELAEREADRLNHVGAWSTKNEYFVCDLLRSNLTTWAHIVVDRRTWTAFKKLSEGE